MKILNNLLLFISIFSLGTVKAQYQSQGDIDYNVMITDVRNDSHCSTDFSSFKNVTVSNSFVGDSIKFIDNNGFLMYAEENINGSSIWNVNTTSINTFWGIDDYNVVGGMIASMEPLGLHKIISGPDTMYVYQISTTVAVQNPCTYNTVSGKIFIDNNSNCVFDSGDQNLQGVSVNVNGYYNPNAAGAYSTGAGMSSHTDGTYDKIIQETWLDSFRISLPSIYAFIYPVNSCNSLTQTFTSLPQTNADFAVQCADLDLSVGAQTGGWIRPMIPFSLYPHAKNIGCDPVSGMLKLLLDPNVTYDAANSQNPAHSISGDTLIWNYSNLSNISNGAYWNSFLGSIQLTPNLSVNAGDILTFKVWTGVPGNDVLPNNNSYTLNRTVVNSYDPNIKEVLPKGIGAENFISATTQKLRYIIHFQNTGTADAINIRVIDTLGANIIPTTMRIINSSHAMIPNWLQSNVLEFKFNQIYLADSASNEPASHGFVTFEIDMVQGLAPETRIENKAFIYFDYNDPIETPIAFVTIENPLHVGDILTSSNLKITVYPNPAQDIVNLSINGEANDMELNIRDVSGKLIFTKSYSNSKLITIDSNFMSNGIYFYEVLNKNTNQNSNGKLIVN